MAKARERGLEAGISEFRNLHIYFALLIPAAVVGLRRFYCAA